jgi:hypothetical protein
MLVLGSLEFLQGQEDTEVDLNSQLGPQCYCPGNEYAKLIPELAEAISKGFSLIKKLRCGFDGSSSFSSTLDCRCFTYFKSIHKSLVCLYLRNDRLLSWLP